LRVRTKLSIFESEVPTFHKDAISRFPAIFPIFTHVSCNRRLATSSLYFIVRLHLVETLQKLVVGRQLIN